MKGYRTIITNVLMVVASVAAIWGIEIPPEMIEEVVSGIIAVIGLVNLFLRAITTTPVGQKE